jgi:L-ascorbate metabolism protein UlaG (beta-lactamase superfamily)
MSPPQVAEAPLTLTYYAHCAFLWQTPQGVRVLIDPYRNRHDRYWFTRQFPHVECDLALVTHAHFDHDAVPSLPESTSVLRLPGEFRYRDLYIHGILDKHSGTRSKGMPNVMFRLETGGVRFLHIGDNDVDWPPKVRQTVGEIDVLMVTVDDSCHLLTYPEVETVITMVQPRVVVPMHYQIPDLMPASTTLRTIDAWLATRAGVRRLESHSITLSRHDLPSSPEVWVFEPSPEVWKTHPAPAPQPR